MNDHNLDDLIIDNIDPKNSKTKSFLTIIALAIVVLIVAIILTKIILKEPNQKLILEEDTTELISPDLTLQSVTEKDSAKPKVSKNPLALNTNTPKVEPKVATKTTTNEVKPKTVAITNEFSQTPSQTQQKEAKLAAEKRTLELKAAAEAKKEKERETKHLADQKAKQQALEVEKEAASTQVSSTNGYFIQVGSFTQTPSSRFLSVIKNSGFNYNITPAASNGTKKLLIGSYATKAEANAALVRVRDRINKSAFVIKK